MEKITLHSLYLNIVLRKLLKTENNTELTLQTVAIPNLGTTWQQEQNPLA